MATTGLHHDGITLPATAPRILFVLASPHGLSSFKASVRSVASVVDIVKQVLTCWIKEAVKFFCINMSLASLLAPLPLELKKLFALATSLSRFRGNVM